MQVPSSPGDDAVDLREYVAVLRRRFRLMAAVTGAVVLLSAAYSFTRTPMYTATAVVLVQPAVSSAQFRPDQLVSLDTEARIAKSAPVAELAKEELGSPLSIQELLKRVTIGTAPDTLVLDVSFTDPDAQEAADGANAFSAAYLDYKRARAIEGAAEDRRDIQDEINRMQGDLLDVEADLAAAAPGSVEERDAQLLRDTIVQQIQVLTGEIASVSPETDPGDIIGEAIAPNGPSSPKHALNLAMGLLLGGFLAVVLAFVRDRTDERITGRADLELTLDAPLLAAIPHATGLGHQDGPWLVTERQPRSPAAEAYRTLRTAVMALSRQRGLKIFAVVSPMLGEGKTTTAANLAVALSHTDSRVLVMTADLRRPALHRCFDRELGIGTADVLLGEATLRDAMEMVSPNLWLLTSGRPPGRPAELLQSHRLPDLLKSAAESFDFVLVDCPPVLGLADTLAVAPFADAVFLVARAESSKRGAIVHAADQLEQVGAMVRGAILNDVPISKRGTEYGYGYGYGGTGDETDTPAPASGRGGREPGERGERGAREPAGPAGRVDGRPGGARSARSGASTPSEAVTRPSRRTDPASQPEAGARADQ